MCGMDTAALAVLLAVLIVRLRVEAEMAGHDLTVTGTTVSQVGRLMCRDSRLTTITDTEIFQDQAHNFQDILSL